MTTKDGTPNATVRKTVESRGQTVSETEETTDDFRDLLKEDGFASVSASYAMGVDHNSEKVTFHISVRCDQNEKTIDLAAERAFHKCVAYVASAGDELGWKKTS